MGEVYRARDLKLGRNVALKVLPAAFAADSDRLARFEREAQLLAALNHPHIASIYGVEDSSDVRALVLELVEGETLADRLARQSGSSTSPLPIDEAISMGKQIADALDAAHSQGIVHRDLKPSNIKVKPDGTVKVLDFGLAKLNGPNVSATMASTITSPPMHTEVGMILGTPAYMAPEQARGLPADKRSDIWAFGCILYEMLTGRRLFDGEHSSDTIALVLTKDPDWRTLPSAVPAAIRTLLRRCFERDPRNRLADAATARFVLEEVGALSATRDATNVPGGEYADRRRWWTRIASVAAGALVVGAITAGSFVWMRTQADEPRLVRTSIPLTGTTTVTVSALRDLSSATPDLALTPDGSRIVYVGNNGTQLFVRRLDSLEPVVIAEGLQLRNPFVSPDGQWVGYAEKRFVLKKVSITGGPSIPLATRLDTDFAGATWLPDDTIVFATFGTRVGLRITTAAAGTPSAEPEPLTGPDQAQGEARHLWPEALPGGQAILFTITSPTGGDDAAQVAVFDRRTKTKKILVPGGSSARYMANADASGANGFLVYRTGGSLRAVAFDANALETRGAALAVAPQVVTMLNGGADFALASNGTLAYVRADNDALGPQTTPVWVDRAGREQPTNIPSRRYGWIRVSPEGTRFALSGGETSGGIWVWDTKRSTLTPIPVPAGRGNGPVWTSDGLRIVFQGSIPGEPMNMWWAAADGSGTAERLTTTKSNPQRPTGVTPDGSRVLFMEAAPSLDVMQLALDSSHTITPLFTTPAWDAGAVVSPNGRWLAYESDVAGRMEVYVAAYPDVRASQQQVSTEGGTSPRWSRDGKHLFFVDPIGTLMRVAVQASDQVWQSSTPIKESLSMDSLGGSWYGVYDAAPDGRFVVIRSLVDPKASPPQIIVVQNFDVELRGTRVN
jgi:serine/threonine-protein kinase